MTDLRQSFTYTFIGTTAILNPEATGTNNADGSNADDTNWDTSYASPWNTVINRWTWKHGGTTHRVIYDRDLGWSSVDIAYGSGWTQSTESNGYIRWTRSSDNAYYEIDPSAAWVSGSPPPPTSGTSTEEAFVPDAKIVNYGGLTGLRFEQRGYPAASYELVGPGTTNTWTLTTQSNSLQHHISNLNPGTWYLYQDSVQVATLVAGKRRVFCNFW